MVLGTRYLVFVLLPRKGVIQYAVALASMALVERVVSSWAVRVVILRM